MTTPDPTRISILDNDEDNCINCDLPVDPKSEHKVLRIDVVQQNGNNGGEITMLEEWRLCADCERSQPSTLTNYVKLRLS